MEIGKTPFPGLFIIQPKVLRDERGFFLESYSKRDFAALGLDCDFVQDNQAYSRSAGVLRGFHFQVPPMAQAKLVWVVAGRVLDVVVDLRKGSPTFGKAFETELSAANFYRLFVPRGFAHAYLTLEEDTEFLYKVDAPYSREHDSGIVWNDPDLGVSWPFKDLILSDKDRSLPRLSQIESPFSFDPETDV
ncbi:MAG: dTDP-4-dehydrorhamnose 3,5-epimerase [Desulfovibrionaceae bacterium]|nr:dTDP-4-dehydrorhamnose 3,5-epimerase [Desulfovibrionaceae bacterium]